MSQTSGAPRRLWDTKAPTSFALRDYGLASQARETDGDGAPSLPIFRISMHRGHCFFAIRLCSAKEGGHGRLGRVETGLLSRALPIVTNEHAKAHRRCLRLGETRCAPLLKSKSKRLLVLVGIWDDFRRPLFDVGESPFFLLGFG